MLIIALCGHHNSGKTTLGTFLCQKLSKEGFKVGVVKSTKEEANFTDREGTDTWRYKEAQTEKIGLLQSYLLTLYLPKIPKNRKALLNLLKDLYWDCDLLLLEGFKSWEGIPKIWVLKEEDNPEEIQEKIPNLELIVHPSEKDKILNYLKEKLRKNSEPEIELKINFQEIPLKHFIQKLLLNLIMGFLKGLKGIPSKIDYIEVKIKKK